MKTVRFFVTLSEPVEAKKLLQAWEDHARLNPGQPRVEFIRVEGAGFEAEAYDTPVDWVADFRRILGEVLLKVDDFCTIREMYHAGVKN